MPVGRRHTLVRHLAGPDQFFDLEADPRERSDLIGTRTMQSTVSLFRDRLARIIDIEDADRRAHAAQRVLVESHGGREAVLARGRMNSAIPGVAPTVTIDRGNPL